MDCGILLMIISEINWYIQGYIQMVCSIDIFKWYIQGAMA